MCFCQFFNCFQCSLLVVNDWLQKDSQSITISLWYPVENLTAKIALLHPQCWIILISYVFIWQKNAFHFKSFFPRIGTFSNKFTHRYSSPNTTILTPSLLESIAIYCILIIFTCSFYILYHISLCNISKKKEDIHTPFIMCCIPS